MDNLRNLPEKAGEWNKQCLEMSSTERKVIG